MADGAVVSASSGLDLATDLGSRPWDISVDDVPPVCDELVKIRSTI
jgi:hypothetical protein